MIINLKRVAKIIEEKKENPVRSPRKEKKLMEWQAELDQVNAEYQFVDQQLKQIEGKV